MSLRTSVNKFRATVSLMRYWWVTGLRSRSFVWGLEASLGHLTVGVHILSFGVTESRDTGLY